MDFIINFLITELRNNTIIIVVDRLSKITHFIPLRFGEGKADIIIVAKLLFDCIFKLYGLLKKIISDRDPGFTFNIARQLYRHARINQFIFITMFPETNGQLKKII